MQIKIPDNFIPAGEAERKLNLYRGAVRQNIKRKRLPEDTYIKIGRDWYVDVEAIEKILIKKEDP